MACIESWDKWTQWTVQWMLTILTLFCFTNFLLSPPWTDMNNFNPSITTSQSHGWMEQRVSFQLQQCHLRPMQLEPSIWAAPLLWSKSYEIRSLHSIIWMLSRRFLILNVVQAEVRLRKGPRAPSKWSNRVMEQSSKWSNRVMELTAEYAALGTYVS